MTWYMLGHILYKFYEVYNIKRFDIGFIKSLYIVDGTFNMFWRSDMEIERDLITLKNLDIIRIDGRCIEIDVERAKILEDLINKDVMLSDDSMFITAQLRKRADKIIESGNIKPDECR